MDSWDCCIGTGLTATEALESGEKRQYVVSVEGRMRQTTFKCCDGSLGLILFQIAEKRPAQLQRLSICPVRFVLQ